MFSYAPLSADKMMNIDNRFYDSIWCSNLLVVSSIDNLIVCDTMPVNWKGCVKMRYGMICTLPRLDLSMMTCIIINIHTQSQSYIIFQDPGSRIQDLESW
jgi:hypothetical protein